MRLPRTGEDLYNAVQPPAEAVKGYIQIGIGIAVVVIFGLQWYSQRHEQFNIAHSALAFVGYGLAVSAAVELAYTFFTKGPDEALDPLILGVSSFALISLSMIDQPKLTMTNAIPTSLFALAILLLFFARRFLLEVEEAPGAGYSEARIALRLGQAVRKRRMALGLSEAELATRAGMTRRTIIRVEAGHTVPTIPMLARFSTALDAELIIEIAGEQDLASL
jgi:DNA-binding XRE family transcriptional regulator